MTDTDRLAELAAIEHEQWMTWARSLMSADDVTIGPERLARWQSYMVPYDELPQEVQRHDKVWAQAIIDGPFRSLVDDNRELRAAVEPCPWCGHPPMCHKGSEGECAALHPGDGA